MVVAGKEFADQLRSARFVVLLFVLGIAAVIPMYFTADAIRTAASNITDRSSLFLSLWCIRSLVPGAEPSPRRQAWR